MNTRNVIVSMVVVLALVAGLSAGFHVGYAAASRTWVGPTATARLVMDFERYSSLVHALDSSQGKQLRDNAVLSLRMLTVQASTIAPYLDPTERERLRYLIGGVQRIEGVFDATQPMGSLAIAARDELLATKP